MLGGFQESGENQVHHLECLARILLQHRAWMDLTGNVPVTVSIWIIVRPSVRKWVSNFAQPVYPAEEFGVEDLITLGQLNSSLKIDALFGQGAPDQLFNYGVFYECQGEQLDTDEVAFAKCVLGFVKHG
ncbi:hypothetical protein AZSP09_04090 [Azospira sp. I09]|nr:hypothetical protein AZSP09_04090 [Azospira sp. I09]